VTRRWVIPAAVIVAFLLQLAWAPRWGLVGGRPELVTLVVVCLAFFEGPLTGAIAGFAGGLLLDSLSLGPLGVGALSLTLTGAAAGMVERTVFGRSLLTPMVAVAVATAGAHVVELVLLVALGRQLPLTASLLRVILPAAMYNGLLAGLVYPLLARLGQRERGKTRVEPLGY
jgi:rod shape-determining protein MreD